MYDCSFSGQVHAVSDIVSTEAWQLHQRRQSPRMSFDDTFTILFFNYVVYLLLTYLASLIIIFNVLIMNPMVLVLHKRHSIHCDAISATRGRCRFPATAQ